MSILASMLRYYPLHSYYIQRYGRRVQKIPLDGGFTCPNRDGFLSRKGCVFCSDSGAGSGMLADGFSLTEQWEYWRKKFHRKFSNPVFIAYFQSYSNTYGPLEKIEKMFNEVSNLPELVGIYLGTRPDCLDDDKLELLASQPVEEIQLDMGLQTSNEQTLLDINRGHTAACFADATRKAAAKGLRVCAHVMMGLPAAHLPDGKEGLKELLETVRFLNELPIHGIKFHNTLVGPQTTLEKLWKKGQYVPMTKEEYMDQLGEALAHTRPDIVVQRIQADALPDQLLAPMWADGKGTLLRSTHRYLDTFDKWQGMNFEKWQHQVPPWFTDDAKGPWEYDGELY